MKVSEAIDRLKVGDTVWVKARVDRINNEGKYIRVIPNASSIYLDGHDEISLTEPRVDKVEVELTRSQADFMKEHENDSLYKLMRASIPEYEELFARARLNGYTVKPKRWIVKYESSGTSYYFTKWYQNNGNPFEPSGSKEKRHSRVTKFTDKSKAEAVATLVEGSVEEA